MEEGNMTFASCMHDVTLNSGGISLLAALGALQYRGCVCRRGCAGVDAHHRDEACRRGSRSTQVCVRSCPRRSASPRGFDAGRR